MGLGEVRVVLSQLVGFFSSWLVLSRSPHVWFVGVIGIVYCQIYITVLFFWIIRLFDGIILLEISSRPYNMMLG